ncbi:MAG TPA: carboxypeptidase-like regulatory domain-containing protein [Anaeromyxobacteraceae bacterium]|nr:carboxypeptidase-like regulatory domain-containing protein [Anaeromyxobacteraceae bacterium]
MSRSLQRAGAVLFLAAAACGSSGGKSSGGGTASISGTVSGAAKQGVNVALSGAASGNATTDAFGNYSFAGLASGNYTLTPSLGTYHFAPATLSVTLAGASLAGQDFVASLGPSYSISGSVSGEVAAGVKVSLGGGATASATTDASGSYSFPGLPAGSYTVTPSLSGYGFSPATASVTVSASNVSGVNFTASVSTTTTTSVLPMPSPASEALQGIVSGAPSIVQDQMPGTGDLLMPVFGSDLYWYLFASQDGGKTWAYLKAPSPSTYAHTGGICQDTVNYDLHFVVNDAANLYYSRLKLARDPNGHVTGWTWDAEEVLVGPAPTDSPGGDPHGTDVRFQLIEAIDGLGKPVLALAYLFDPASPSFSSTLAMLKTTESAGVSPTAHGDFVGLDGQAGPTIVTTTPVDTGSACGQPWWNIHDLLIGLAQHPATHTLYVFRGPAGDPANCSGTANQQSVVLWTYEADASDANFTLSSPAAGTVLSSGTSSQTAHWGGTFPTEDSIWIAFYSPTGPQFDRVTSDGTYHAQVLPNPDPTGAVAGYLSVAVNAAQTEAWATWVGSTPNDNYTDTYSGHWNGGAWDNVAKVSGVDMSGFGSSLYWRGGLAVAERSDQGVILSSTTDPTYEGQIQVIRTSP